MSSWRNLLAGTFGFAIGGPIGALLGVIAGHSVDKIRSQSSNYQDGIQSTQEVITVGVIILAAKLAKEDGQVTSDEVSAFKEKFQITPNFQSDVGKIFNEAKLRSTDKSRFEVVNKLGKAGSLYRNKIYKNKFTGQYVEIPKADVIVFLASLNEHLDHAIEMNKRSDNLYHAYNLLTIDKDKVKISHLPEMLEGQVAALSSGKINPKQAVALLDSLKNSELYRKDQLSYILYPAKKLPGFLEKNIIAKNLFTLRNFW